MAKRLTTEELHRTLLDLLGSYVESHSDISEKPLMVKLTAPYNWKLKIYLYNCTNPPGARQAGECKSQIILPGQKRGERGSFIIEPGIITLLMGFARPTWDEEDGVFVIWELKKHMEFAYSANVQVSLAMLLQSYSEPVYATQKRGNGEWIVVSQPDRLIDAIKKRVDVDIDLLLGE